MVWNPTTAKIVAIAEKGGIPRGQMKTVLSHLIPSKPQIILAVMTRILDLFRREKGNDPVSEISYDFTHREDAENIVRCIWRKWDIAENCPLPEGVERAWGRGSKLSDPAKIIWIKTGEPYVDT